MPLHRRALLAMAPALMIGGCGDWPFTVRKSELINATPAQINARTSFADVPGTARDIRYFVRGFQSYQEFLAFKDSRDRVDAFCRAFIDFVPTDFDTATTLPEPPDSGGWWVPTGVDIHRSGRNGPGPKGEAVGVRRLWIRDLPDFSQVWALHTGT